jgi:hypothetical protein
MVINIAYYNTKGTLTIDSEAYVSGVSSCALVPNTPTATHVDIGGGIQNFAGEPDWVLQLTFSQDWTTPESLSIKSIEWAGTEKTVTYTPDDGGASVTADVIFQASQMGGGARAVPTATLNLGVNGQPDFTFPEPTP